MAEIILIGMFTKTEMDQNNIQTKEAQKMRLFFCTLQKISHLCNAIHFKGQKCPPFHAVVFLYPYVTYYERFGVHPRAKG